MRCRSASIPGDLSVLERDLLKDSLAAVKRFKAMLRHRFHLDPAVRRELALVNTKGMALGAVCFWDLPRPFDEWVAIVCETTGLDRRRDRDRRDREPCASKETA